LFAQHGTKLARLAHYVADALSSGPASTVAILTACEPGAQRICAALTAAGISVAMATDTLEATPYDVVRQRVGSAADPLRTLVYVPPRIEPGQRIIKSSHALVLESLGPLRGRLNSPYRRTLQAMRWGSDVCQQRLVYLVGDSALEEAPALAAEGPGGAAAAQGAWLRGNKRAALTPLCLPELDYGAHVAPRPRSPHNRPF
jgi:hypothetical protein